MKKIILIFSALFFFAATAYAQPYHKTGSRWCRDSSGALTPCGAESVAMATMTATDGRTGVSTFAINGNTALTASECDGRLYCIPESATAPIIKLPAPALGRAVGFENATGAAGTGTGATWWATGSPTIYAGEGTAAISGVTLFANSGVTRQAVWYWADIVGGTLAWKASTNMPLNKLP